MADKNKELECLEKVLKSKNVNGQYVRDLQKLLLQKKEYINCNSERSDIMIRCGFEVSGIENRALNVRR